MANEAFTMRAPQTGAIIRGTVGYVLTAQADGTFKPQAGGGGGAVASVFGRVGAVTAQLGDYAASKVTNDSAVAGATVKDALNTLAAGAGVTSVFGRVGAVVAVANDYNATQVSNTSGVAGASVKDALNTLAAVIAAGVLSVFGRVGAVTAAANDYAASQVQNDSGVAGVGVAAALNTLNAPINLTGARVSAGPPNTFLAGGAVNNQWLPVFTAPANPGDNGKAVIASAGDFSYVSGATGQPLIWNGAAFAASTDFAAQNLTTTGGFIGNSGTSFTRYGLVNGSGAGVASAASTGNIRGARGANGFSAFVRDNTDANDLTAWTTDTTSGPSFTLCSTTVGGFSPVISAPAAGNVTLRVGTSSTQLQLTTAVVSSLIPIVQFFSTVTNGTFGYQSTATNAATGKKLFVVGQDCTGTTTTGGDTDYRPGSGTTAGGKGRLMSGGGAVSSAQRLAWNDTGVGLYTATPVAQAARVGQLTDSTTGTPSTTLVDVGVAFSQANINNNFASCLAKINAIELIVHNIGMSA